MKHPKPEERRAAICTQLKNLRSHAARVLSRFQEGECVMVVRGVHWWNRDGALGLRLTDNEKKGLSELVEIQALELVTKILRT